jgi:polyhydroxybutyrate depolymerase
MRKAVLLLLSVISIQLSHAQLTAQSIEVNGTNRTYYQYLPTGYDPGTEQVPVVFLLHGIGGTAANAATYGLNPIADTARFIAIYPQGLSNGSQTSWNNGTLLASSAEDVLFISRLMDSVNNEHNVDLARMYVSGISMGAIMTFRLCDQLSDRIAAAAPHIGTMSSTDNANYNPTYPVPMLQSHGTNDGTVPYDSNPLPSLTLVPQTLNALKTANGFQGDSTIYAIPDNAADGITVDRIVYNCTTPLEHWKWNGADHILLYQPVHDTTTMMYTWIFFSQFTHPNPSTASIENFHTPEIKVYPNPTQGAITISNSNEYGSVKIFSAEGRLINELDIESNQIDVSSLESGTYIFQFIDNQNNNTPVRIIID